MRSWVCLWRVLWAAPCSLLGLALSLPILAAGGSVRKQRGVVEIAFASQERRLARLLSRLPFSAITLGHVVLGVRHETLSVLRAHEHAHVRQFERWGVLLLLAYPLASLVSFLRGRGFYYHNAFEVQARAQESRTVRSPAE